MYERNLIPHQSVAGIVATYQQAQKEITTAYGLLDQAKKRLKLTGIDDKVLEPKPTGRRDRLFLRLVEKKQTVAFRAL